MFSTLRITSNCNLRCLYCYSDSHNCAPQKELSTASIKSVIDILVKNSIDHITISGGEPFTRPDIFEILSYSSGKTKTGIVTNGSLIDKSTAKKLSGIEISNLMISLDGPKEIHDSLRGKGSFHSAQIGISNSLESGLPVGISTTLASINHGHMAEIYDFLKERKIRRWIIEILKPEGRSKGSGLYPDDVQKKSALSMLYNLSGTEKDMKISVFDCENNCSAGRNTISVSPDGSVTPCAFMSNALCGNILKDPWDNIAAKIKEFQTKGITCFQNC